MKDRVLAALRAAQNEYLSGEKLSADLGISRTAVWKHVNALRQQGYEIEAHPHLGYRVMSFPDTLFPREIASRLHTLSIGRKIHHFDALDSTNEEAKRLAEGGAEEGTVVVAEKQLHGKGRLGRNWFSPRGGIWMSVVLRPAIWPHQATVITLLAAVAVRVALKSAAGVDALIKWPNDVYINGKKICGILTEMKAETERVEYVIVGMGINANMDEESITKINPAASSLQAICDRKVDRKALCAEVLAELERCYELFEKNGPAAVLELWKRGNCTLGRQVQLSDGTGLYSGFAEDVNEYGGLLVRDNRGQTRVFYSGEVTLRNEE